MAARGNRIVLTEDRGVPVEGIIGSAVTAYPGQIVQPDLSQSLQGGRETWVLFNADIDGGRPKGAVVVLREDFNQGKTIEDAWVAGERARGFVPWPGCRLNLYWRDVDTGTSTNDLAIGTVGIIQDGTGKIIATTGSPENEVCLLLEAISNLDGDEHGFCEWTGY